MNILLEALRKLNEENKNELNPKIFYKCSVDNEYFASIYPEKIREKNPKDKNIWILELKENGNIEDCENGKQYYLNNVIGDKEALDEYINRKQQEKITILESLRESIIDEEDKEEDEDEKDWRVEADGEILLDPDLEEEEKFKTKEDALDFIGFLDYEHEWENWDPETEVKVVNIKTGESEVIDIEELHKKLTNESLKELKEESNEEDISEDEQILFDEEATKILKERFLNKQVEVIVDYGGTGPDKWDTKDWVVIDDIEVYSPDSQITVDLYRDFSQQINGRDYSFRYSGWITLDFKDFEITENMSTEEKLNQLKNIPFNKVENIIFKAAANNGCKIEAY